jgi:hypothetical protein
MSESPYHGFTALIAISYDWRRALFGYFTYSRKGLMLRIISLLFLSMLCSCASILSTSTYAVTFDSSPSGAEIVVRNKSGNAIHKGVTPTTLTLNASNGFFQPSSYQITATMPGYNPGIATLSAGLDGWYVGNLIFGGLLGILIVDPATGAMWRLRDRVVVSMGPKSDSVSWLPEGLSPQGSGGFRVIDGLSYQR